MDADLKKERWNDQLDAAKYLTYNFNSMNDVLTTDFILAKLEPVQRDGIKETITIAFMLKEQIPDREIGHRIFTKILLQAYAVAVLHRNLDKNVLVEVLGNKSREKEEEIPTAESLITRTVNKLKGKKKEEVEE